jgi:hypothetical protein
MKLKLTAAAAGVVGIALAAAGCGSTADVGSSGTSSASGSAAASGSTGAVAAGFGSANKSLCSGAVDGKPGYKNAIGTIAGGGGGAKTLTGAGFHLRRADPLVPHCAGATPPTGP